MKTTPTLREIVGHPYFSLACILSVAFLLPQLGSVAVMVGCAAILSALVLAQPEAFRSRRGSMRPATYLVIAMWVAAGVVAALALTGGIDG
ncbi:MAG: hypothetical protein ACR2RV_00770 [Verrucomicrobiales bacterium]